MGKQHVVHASTRRAVLEAHTTASLKEIAKRMGHPELDPALSQIARGVPGPGRDAERQIRIGLGLPPRHLSPSDIERQELQKQLKAKGITLNQAIRMALAQGEG